MLGYKLIATQHLHLIHNPSAVVYYFITMIETELTIHLQMSPFVAFTTKFIIHVFIIDTMYT